MRWGPVGAGPTAADPLLRSTVAALVGVEASDVAVERRCATCQEPHGRPSVLVRGRPGPGASIAHAGELGIVAVGWAEVGIDLEPWADRRDVADVVLAPSEAAALAALDDLDDLDDAERGRAVLRTWVRKEAVLKLVGCGLTVDPRALDLGPPLLPPRVVSWAGPGRLPPMGLADLDAVPGHVGAVARSGRGPVVLDVAGPGPIDLR